MTFFLTLPLFSRLRSTSQVIPELESTSLTLLPFCGSHWSKGRTQHSFLDAQRSPMASTQTPSFLLVVLSSEIHCHLPCIHPQARNVTPPPFPAPFSACTAPQFSSDPEGTSMPSLADLSYTALGVDFSLKQYTACRARSWTDCSYCGTVVVMTRSMLFNPTLMWNSWCRRGRPIEQSLPEMS